MLKKITFPKRSSRQSTKLDIQQIEWANKHILSLKNAARVIQIPLRSVYKQVENLIT